MSRRLSLLLLPFVAACASTAQQAPAPAPAAAASASGYQLVSYLPNWQSDEARARAADVLHRLDVGVYSFIEVKPDGTGYVADASKPVAQTWRQAFAKARKVNPKLACQWAIGGWTGSRNIAKVAQTDAGRARLASTSVAIMREYDCQGLDLDWEHPVTGGDYAADASEADRDNWVKLLQALRDALDAQGAKDGQRYFLTAAIPNLNGGWVLSGYQLKGAVPLLDRVYLMSYDIYGAWSKVAGLHATLYPIKSDPDGSVLNGAGGVQYFLNQGFKPSQLVLGVPFYARAQAEVPPGPNGDGLGQSSKGPGLKDQPDPGTITYADMKAQILGKPGWKSFRSKEHGDAPYLYSTERQEFLSYDDPQSLKVKADFVKAKQLGGVMIWELTQDDAEHSLLNALTSTLR